MSLPPVCNRMSEALGRLLGSLSTWPREESDVSASFGFRDSSYDDGGWDADPQDHYVDSSGYGHDHYGGHSGYHEGHCCPLVVDALCLAAILGSIAGATVFLARVFQIELMAGRRRRRSVPYTSCLHEGKQQYNGKPQLGFPAQLVMRCHNWLIKQQQIEQCCWC